MTLKINFLCIYATIGLGFLPIAVTAIARHPFPRGTVITRGQNVVYWGQNGGNAVENDDLATYCTPSSGIDIIVLSFLYQYGSGNTVASGTIGRYCYISPQGVPRNCDALASAIEQCQSNGVKILLSLGGATGTYSLQSQTEAETIGQNLWYAYGNATSMSVPRPFGKTFVNGWDFDIEVPEYNEHYAHLIKKLRSNFPSDTTNTYLITGAPQCPIPEPNMETMIQQSQFDYLWVQFYNNPQCSVNGAINFNDWVASTTNTASSNAKIFIGVPASPLAATGTDSGAKYYLEPNALASLIRQYATSTAFGGVMIWSAAFSDLNINNGCTYAQEAKCILETGLSCYRAAGCK